jgi:membrane protein required for beta-lactamase induction
MAKLTAWVVTILGIVLLLIPLGIISLNELWLQWALAIGVLIIGIGKLVRNYSYKKKKK